MYLVRNESGILIAKISDRDAIDIISKFGGEWGTVELEKTGKINKYTLHNDVISTNKVTGMTVYYWKDYYIYKET